MLVVMVVMREGEGRLRRLLPNGGGDGSCFRSGRCSRFGDFARRDADALLGEALREGSRIYRKRQEKVSIDENDKEGKNVPNIPSNFFAEKTLNSFVCSVATTAVPVLV
jgi:hypothetical protein